MSTRSTVIKLGPAFAGLSLKAQPIDSSGVAQGSAITTGFIDQSGGEYVWTTDSIYSLFRIEIASTSEKLTVASIPDEQGTAITVTPILASVSLPTVDEKEIIVYEDTQGIMPFTAVDADNNPLDLDGHDVRFLTFDDYFSEESVLFTVEAGDLTIENGTVTVPYTNEHTATPGRHKYALRDLTAGNVIITGVWEVRALPTGEE